jgi:hypothetical protein
MLRCQNVQVAECIYCRAFTEAVAFARPEHVIPRAFGHFEANLTIFCVCQECNQWFGDHLEVSFNRNSGEALMRLMSGVKPHSEAAEVRGHRIEITAGEGSMRFPGAKSYFTQSADGTKLVAAFVPQVGFAPTETNEPILFTEPELTREIVKQYASYECLIIGETEEDYERLSAKLQELGSRAESVLWWHPNPSLQLVLEPLNVNYRLDDGVFRTIGKIAFNYLAFEAGAAFCLHSDLDPFRRFVRYGEGDWRSFIALSQEPLLFGEHRFGVRQTRGHLLAVTWPVGNDSPTASVKLFNDIHYHIRFARRLHALWRDLRSGHHFDINTLTIQPITIV